MLVKYPNVANCRCVWWVTTCESIISITATSWFADASIYICGFCVAHFCAAHSDFVYRKLADGNAIKSHEPHHKIDESRSPATLASTPDRCIRAFCEHHTRSSIPSALSTGEYPVAQRPNQVRFWPKFCCALCTPVRAWVV